tara:strand:- start:803 stop:1891 length:1089 start_codon:yes stop_codon:yes gene_type:complete
MSRSDLIPLLEELSNVGGPSGFEDPVRKIVERELADLVDFQTTDGLGSSISVLSAPQSDTKVLLSAHMDELGLMIKRITPEGYLKFHPLGGWLAQAVIGQRWMVRTRSGDIPAITGIKTVHVMDQNERSQVFKMEQMFLDIGAESADDAINRLGVRPGDPVYPDTKFVKFAGGNRLIGKAWDDRVGVAIMIEVLKQLKDRRLGVSVIGAATVQEEVGLRGAQTAGFVADADIAINLESGVAADYPGITLDEAQEELGAGPSIFFHDSSMLPNTRFRDFVVSIAERESIPIQFNVLSGYGQDGSAVQRTRAGVPVVNIAVPTRYLHSHQGVVDIRDIAECVRLVTKVVTELTETVIKDISSFS